MDDLDELGLPVLKTNRRRKLSPKTHTTEVGPLPPAGIHELSRKDKEKLEKKKLEELIKKV